MTDLEKMAKGLKHGRKRAVCYLSAHWTAGPHAPQYVLNALDELRDLGIIERECFDMTAPAVSETKRGMKFRVSACWHFRLNETGLALREHLKGGEG